MDTRNLTENSTAGVSKMIQERLKEFSIDKTKLITVEEIVSSFQSAAKLHIGMLSISLIVGLGYGGYVAYNCWREKNVFLSHIRNLVIALTCRTFFSLLFEGVIILESPFDVDGGNTLLSFECICLNLVLAYWLLFTIYIHARVETNFNSEPSLTLYSFVVPGVALYFAFVWIFGMEGSHSSYVWWWIHEFFPLYQWVVSSLRLLYLFIQLGLLIHIGKMMMVKSTDNDTVSLLRKVSVMMGVLVLLFWLQFGLSVGRPPIDNLAPYLYFYYFIDGIQCLSVCIVLFFFNMWVPMFLDKIPNVLESEDMPGRAIGSNDEVLLRGNSGRGIVTIDSVFMTQESKRWTNENSDARGDVVYSSIVQPENLQKTIDLYKRLNVIPNDKVTIVEGEEFYDCDLRPKRNDSGLLKHIQNLESDKNPKEEKNENERVVNKNAFYSSKYLIVDSKEKDIPKYLETRPWSYSTGTDSPKEELQRELSKSLETLRSDELVTKWLKDHSDDMEDIQKASLDKSERKKIEKRKEKITQNVTKTEEDQKPKFTETVVETVNSIILDTLFPSEKEENVNKENEKVPNTEAENLEVNETNKKSRTQEGVGPNLNKNDCEEELALRLAVAQNGDDDVKIIEENELKPSEEERNENKGANTNPKCPPIIVIDEEPSPVQNDKFQNNIKDTEKLEVENNSDMYGNSSESECDNTPTELEPPVQKKKILIPSNDFLNDVETGAHKDQTEPQENPETFLESILSAEEEKSSEEGQDVQDTKITIVKNLEKPNDLEENDQNFTYSDLLAFRAQRDKLEKENQNEKDRTLKMAKLTETNLLSGKPHQKLSHSADDNWESSI